MVPQDPPTTLSLTLLERARSIVRRVGLDVALALMGVAFGWFTLWYPFGHDQGLYYYVGREWLQHGSLPYRDMVEQKTPGVFLLHGFLVEVFGEQQWAIRLADLVGVVGVGVVAARFVTPRGELPRQGTQGFSVVLVSVLYFGFFYFWDTAQCELWCVLLAMTSLVAARRIEHDRNAALVSGLLSGLAVIMKPPGVWFAMLAAPLLLARVGRSPTRWVSTGCWFLLGAGAPLLLLVSYFGTHHAIGAMYDILVGANGYYVEHDRAVRSLHDLWLRSKEIVDWYQPISGALFGFFCVGLYVAFVQQDRNLITSYGLSSAVLVAAYLGIAMQLKFYRYHWGLLVGPAATLGAVLYGQLGRLAANRSAGRVLGAVLPVGVLGVLFLIAPKSEIWFEAQHDVVALLNGDMNREAYTRRFLMPALYYFYHDSERAGTWLLEHSNENDNVLVRGFNPEVYAIAHRHYLGRFFWTPFLTDPHRAYRREAWLREDRQAIVEHPPRFVVTLSDIPEGLDSTAWFLPLGYHVREAIEHLTILERNP